MSDTADTQIRGDEVVETETPNTGTSELLAESLFTAKVREMVKGYKAEILKLEEDVRNAVAENFKYLDMPEPGRITGIIEKHISNMNAEILGIKEELTHFELDKLYKPKGFDFFMTLRPYGIRFWDIWGRSHGKTNDTNNYFENFFSQSYAWTDVKTNGIGVHWNFGQVLQACFFSSKYNRLIAANNWYQQIGGHHAYNWTRNYINDILSTSGSGSVASRGQGLHGIGSVYGYGIPEAGYYLIDMRMRTSTIEYFRMLRAKADGSLTGESNSELAYRESTGYSNTNPVLHTGDFMGDIAYPCGINSAGDTVDYPGPRDMRFTSEGFWSTGIPSYLAAGKWNDFKYPEKGSPDSAYNKCFVYYWTWRDELPTTQDVKNVEDIIKTLIECYTRGYMYYFQNNRNDRIVIPLDKQLNPEIGFPKGCRHEEQVFKNPYKLNENAKIHSGNGRVWNEKILGVSAAEAEEDRRWRAQAIERGEPVMDLNEHCRKYYGDLLNMFMLWGRFARDQKTFHDAQRLASEPDASEKAKKNYETLKRWFYTKYDHYRNKQAAEKVELFSSDLMRLINSTDMIGESR